MSETGGGKHVPRAVFVDFELYGLVSGNQLDDMRTLLGFERHNRGRKFVVACTLVQRHKATSQEGVNIFHLCFSLTVNKRLRVKPFVKYVNYNHMMPSRYLAPSDLDTKALVTDAQMDNPDGRSEAKKATREVHGRERCKGD